MLVRTLRVPIVKLQSLLMEQGLTRLVLSRPFEVASRLTRNLLASKDKTSPDRDTATRRGPSSPTNASTPLARLIELSEDAWQKQFPDVKRRRHRGAPAGRPRNAGRFPLPEPPALTTLETHGRGFQGPCIEVKPGVVPLLWASLFSPLEIWPLDPFRRPRIGIHTIGLEGRHFKRNFPVEFLVNAPSRQPSPMSLIQGPPMPLSWILLEDSENSAYHPWC